MMTMVGRVCVVTGASSGIGKATAMALAARGATVVMVCRDGRKAELARAEIRAATGGRVGLLRADLSSQRQVRAVAAEILMRYPRLDVLVNNAGAIFGRRHLSEDGLEMTLAVNHFAPFLLTGLLLGQLESSRGARIINVSSGVHRIARIDFADLQGEGQYSPLRAYAQSKLANVLFTRHLALRVADCGIAVHCVDPGLVNTGFGHGGTRGFRALVRLLRPSMRTPDWGADTLVWLASSPEMAAVTGGYFHDRKPAPISKAARDPVIARFLWEVSERLTGLAEPSRADRASARDVPPPAGKISS